MKTTSANFDPVELAKFSSLATRWWDPESEFRPLHQINPLRLAWIDSLAPLSKKTVLDVGCGGGILAESMATLGATVTGIDLAEKPLKVAALHAQDTGVDVRYIPISAEELSGQEPELYDIVTCMEMLEHVPQPELVVNACAKLVVSGGWVFFSTINRTPLSWIVAILGAEYVLRLLPKATHRYRGFIQPAELTSWSGAAGLELRDRRGLSYNPFKKTFRLHSFLGVGYLLAMQRVV